MPVRTVKGHHENLNGGAAKLCPVSHPMGDAICGMGSIISYEINKAFPNLADFQRRYGAVWVEPGLPELQKQFTFRCFITRKLWRARAGVDRVKVAPPHSIRRNLHKICTMIGIHTVQ